MKKRLSLVLTAALFVALFVAATPASAKAGSGVPQTPTTITSYTGCLSPILAVVYDVAPGESPAHPPCRPPASMIHLSSGDVTGLVAGTGLTGGGDSGSVSVGIDPAYRLPQSCASGQTAGWNGTGWACASSASHAELNSLIQLLSDPGTINNGSNPVHWTKLRGVPAGFADGTDDTGPSYANGFGLNLAGTTFSVDPASVQSRVSGTCPAGSAIGEIAQDGSVTCRGHAAYTAGGGLDLSGGEFSLSDEGVTTANLSPGSVTLSKLSFDSTTQVEFDTYRALLSSVGEVNTPGNPLDWTQLNGVPGGFADGADDTGLASVATGTGLTGSGTSGDVLQIDSSYRAPQSCASGQVPKWNGTSWTCGNDNEGSGGGTVGRTPAANRITTLDSSGDVGRYSSVTIGSDGLGLISYYDVTNADLKVAHCSDTACSASTSTTLDSGGDVGSFSSVTIGADGLALISYYNDDSGDLKVAHCTDATCSAADISTVDSGGDVGGHTSITIGADGLGLISYVLWMGSDLKIAHCANTICSTATSISLPSPASEEGYYTSIAVGSDGLGLISYFDETHGDLKVAHCSNTVCSAATVIALDGPPNLGEYTSLTIGPAGFALISYYDVTAGALKVARCIDVTCSAAALSTIDNTGDVGRYSSMTVGPDGLGLITYRDETNGNLKFAHCANENCNLASTTTLGIMPASVGQFTSVTVGSDGLGLVSYYNATSGNLMVAHLSNAFGVPYFRRR